MAFCGPPAGALAAFRPTSPSLFPIRLRIPSFSPPTKRRPPTRRIVASSGCVPERIAVIGGGLAGLATAYHLLHSTYRVANKRGEDFTKISVAVFDPSPPGAGGASGVAAGLLHPFSPRVKRKAWQSLKGVGAARTLIDAAQLQTTTPLMKTPGIARLSMSTQQYEDFKTAEYRFKDELQMMSPEALADRLPDPPEGKSGVMQLEGAIVNTPAYLRALWAACEETGRAAWHLRAIDNFEDVLEDYDAVVVCAGAATRAVSNLASLPIMACRGQTIRYRPRFPDTTPVTPCPVISGKWLIPDAFSEDSPGDLLGGASFEYCEADRDPEYKLDFARGMPPDLEEAKAYLTEPLAALMPMLHELYTAEEATSGVRALPPRSLNGSIPIAGEITGAPEGKAAWVFTALGSRGLLYHAWLGKLVARSVVAGCDVLIPHDVKRVPMVFDDLVGPHNPLTATKLQEKKAASMPGVAKSSSGTSGIVAQ